MIKRITFSVLAAICCLMSHAAAVSTVDDLAGTYVATVEGWQWFNYSSWAALPSGHSVTVTKTADNTVTIENLLGYGTTLTGTVDLAANTITTEPVDGLNTWFTLADTTSADKGIVGKIQEDGSVMFDNFTAWYGTATYIYTGAVAQISKSVADWTVTGTLAYYNGTDTTVDPVHSATSTLTKYTSGESVYYGLKMDGENASPAELQFIVEGDSIGITNGSQTAGYAGSYLYYCYGDIYYIWFDTSAGCTSFPATNSKEAGSLYLYHYDYDTSANEKAEGLVTFTWGADGIASAKADAAKKDAPVYDLQGRRMGDTLVPGIYVQNGKKFVKNF